LNDCAMVTVPCLVTVAAGVLAPGHLGELTRYLPFELADDVLESTRTVQRRMRALPSRVGIYFVLAMTLFPGLGYLRVWDKMTAALEGPGLPRPSEKALRAVLDGLLPARRARYSARKVKCSTSRYHVRDQGRPGLPTRIARVLVTIIAPPPDRSAALPRGRKEQPPGPRQPQPDTRRDKVTRIMAGQPGRDWAGRDLAALLGIKPRNLLTQLAEWTRLGLLAKTGQGRYALPGPSGPDTASAGP